MKWTYALLAFFGSVSAISSLGELEDGLYTVSAEKGYPDFNTTTPLRIDDLFKNDIMEPKPRKNVCFRDLRTPVIYKKRKMDVDERDYARARVEFEAWIDAMNGTAMLGPGTCKYAKAGSAVVGACSYGSLNPVCKEELDSAMRGADMDVKIGGCGGPQAGCAVKIRKWRKYYCRVNVAQAPNELKSHKC